MSKTKSDFVKAFKCKRCGSIIVNSEELPERYNEYTESGDLVDGCSEVESPGRLEAHTKILEHSREMHDGDFIDMYEKVELDGPQLEALISQSEEAVA